MPNLYDRFLDRENFYFAFKKLSSLLRQCNEWYDPVELCSYEANLSNHLPKIINEIKEGVYSPRPIQPLPFPKGNEKNGQSRMRHYFRVSIDDQLVWIALINVLGEKLEDGMPFWSYGNRLYRPIWYEINNKTGKEERHIGSVNNASKNFFRKWNQTWPLYRRHIAMTIKTMAYNVTFKQEFLNDKKEENIFENETGDIKNKYLSGSYWGGKGELKELNWMGLDFEKFFPSIKSESVIKGVRNALIGRDDVGELINLMQRMLRLKVDVRGWDINVLIQIGIVQSPSNLYYQGLPTGLFASGILANLAMSGIDKKVSKWIDERRSVAVFKYVDDHIIIGKSLDDIREFYEFYKGELDGSDIGVKIQVEKLIPKEAFSGDEWNDDGIQSTVLDVDFPEPLMTQTIEKMSALNEDDFELSTDNDLERGQVDLEQFLISNFPDSEMRKDTRMAFAATRLTQMSKYINLDFRNLDFTLPDNLKLAVEHAISKLDENTKNDRIEKRKKIVESDEVAIAIKDLVAPRFKEEVDNYKRRVKRISRLLLKAVRENPEKIKLWKRSIQFCLNTGSNNLDEIFNEINNVPLHEESRVYLRSYCLLCIHKELLTATNVLYSTQTTFWPLFKCWNFFTNIIKSNFENFIKRVSPGNGLYPFEEETLFFFTEVCKIVKGTCNEVPQTLLDGFVDTNDESIAEDESCQLDLLTSLDEAIIWYVVTHLPKIISKSIWRKCIDSLELSKPISWSILSLYPTSIPLESFDRIIDDVRGEESDREYFAEEWNLKKGNAFLLDIFSNNMVIRKKYLNHYPALGKIFDRDKTDFLTLQQWLAECMFQSRENNNNWIDPRLSEWTSIEIIIQIAEGISEKIYDNKRKKFKDGKFGRDMFSNDYRNFYKIHPVNYLVPISWLDKYDNPTWNQWKNLVRKDKIEIAEKDELINDFRYLPLSNVWRRAEVMFMFGGGELAVVIGLSVLFTKILSKDFSWPSTSNKLMFIDELFSQAIRTIESEAVSSDTRILLGEIFSKKDFDFFMGSQIISLPNNQKIVDLSDFVKHLKIIKRRLGRAHVSGDDRVPRQLTYIDISALNSTSDNFFLGL